jgi:hypothetical protein
MCVKVTTKQRNYEQSKQGNKSRAGAKGKTDQKFEGSARKARRECDGVDVGRDEHVEQQSEGSACQKRRLAQATDGSGQRKRYITHGGSASKSKESSASKAMRAAQARQGG